MIHTSENSKDTERILGDPNNFKRLNDSIGQWNYDSKSIFREGGLGQTLAPTLPHKETVPDFQKERKNLEIFLLTAANTGWHRLSQPKLMRKVRRYNTLRSVICLPLIISLRNSHPEDFSHFLKRSTLAEKIESILWFASLLTLEWGCWELNYQRGNTRYWIGIPPSIGSMCYHKKSSHHACPLQWVVHTAGYLESPPSLRFRSSKLPPTLPDLVDRSPSETGHPPRGLTMSDVFIDIRWTVSLQSQNSWIETDPILGQIQQYCCIPFQLNLDLFSLQKTVL